MTGYRVFIADWRPHTVNNLFGHWAVRHKKKKADAKMIWAYCQQIPKATKKRLVRVRITLKGNQKACDQDNSWKSLLDALVVNGLLVDDSDKWVQTIPIEFKRGITAGTEILLMDIDECPSGIAHGITPENHRVKPTGKRTSIPMEETV